MSQSSEEREPEQQSSSQPGIDLRYIRQTFQTFLDRETTGGLLLIAATIVALIVANSEWKEFYSQILHYNFVLGIEDHLTLKLTVEHLVNDGLMVIFFLVVGLEIKRELLVGELSSIRKASMPLLAALGGMVVPAAIFIYLNIGQDTISGWGIPMATDIAYCLGILGLLGSRAPVGLKIFLTALAIADDIGAILVIALFYSNELSMMYIGGAGVIFVILFTMNLSRVKNLTPYLLLGVLFWLCFLYSGIHPTIAGVLFALTVPIRPKLDSRIFKERAERLIRELGNADVQEKDPLTDHKQRSIIENLRTNARQSHTPLLRLENALTGFNAYIVIPVFALTNAGVMLDVGLNEIAASAVGLGVFLGLVVGKIVGVSLFSYVGHLIGIASLPRGLTWAHILGGGLLAGIGFTMSLFITNLAGFSAEQFKLAKISILMASLVSAILGILVLAIQGRTEEDKKLEQEFEGH